MARHRRRRIGINAHSGYPYCEWGQLGINAHTRRELQRERETYEERVRERLRPGRGLWRSA
jgi:hypothetical protein